MTFTAGRTDADGPWGWLPSLDCCGNQLIDEFCSSADVFCNRDHLDSWRASAGSPAGEAHSLGELADIGRAVWDHCR